MSAVSSVSRHLVSVFLGGGQELLASVPGQEELQCSLVEALMSLITFYTEASVQGGRPLLDDVREVLRLLLHVVQRSRRLLMLSLEMFMDLSELPNGHPMSSVCRQDVFPILLQLLLTSLRFPVSSDQWIVNDLMEEKEDFDALRDTRLGIVEAIAACLAVLGPQSFLSVLGAVAGSDQGMDWRDVEVVLFVLSCSMQVCTYYYHVVFFDLCNL